MPSKLAMQIADDDWAANRQIIPIVTEPTMLADDAQEGCDGAENVVVVDWNSVELAEQTDLVIAPVANTEMATLFGIPVDDEDKEKEKGSAESAGYADVDPKLMKDVADDVDDDNNDEMINVFILFLSN